MLGRIGQPYNKGRLSIIHIYWTYPFISFFTLMGWSIPTE